jgi:hypothetical protein
MRQPLPARVLIAAQCPLSRNGSKRCGTRRLQPKPQEEETMADTEKLTVAVGKILSDPVFRRAFAVDPKGTLADSGLEVDDQSLEQLVAVNARAVEKVFAKPNLRSMQPENALHVNVASSVGVA